MVGGAEAAEEQAGPPVEEMATAGAPDEVSPEVGLALLLDGVTAATQTPRANRPLSPLENSAPETACSIEAFFARWRLAAKGGTGPM